MSKSHIMYVTFLTFKKGIETLKTSDLKTKENLTFLCQLMGLYEIFQESAALYETGYFQPGSG